MLEVEGPERDVGRGEGSGFCGRRLSVTGVGEAGRGSPPRQEDELGTRAGGKVRAEGRALGAGHERGTKKTLHQASLLRGEPSDASMSPSFLQVSPSLPDPWTEKHFPDDLSRLPFIG